MATSLPSADRAKQAAAAQRLDAEAKKAAARATAAKQQLRAAKAELKRARKLAKAAKKAAKQARKEAKAAAAALQVRPQMPSATRKTAVGGKVRTKGSRPKAPQAKAPKQSQRRAAPTKSAAPKRAADPKPATAPKRAAAPKPVAATAPVAITERSGEAGQSVIEQSAVDRLESASSAAGVTAAG